MITVMRLLCAIYFHNNTSVSEKPNAENNSTLRFVIFALWMNVQNILDLFDLFDLRP